MSEDYTTAVLIPAYNEEATIETVVASFRESLGDAEIYVFDNNSSDNTVELARKAGAIVRREPYQGKGNVVRRMFADISSDVYVLVDADATYDATAAPAMISLLQEDSLDMVVGARVSDSQHAFPPGHRFGNRMLNLVVRMLFGRQFEDMLSGYRVFSRRFVKSFPVQSSGFEIETELTVHALEMRMATAEYRTDYFDRPTGSESKLSTYSDGLRILRTIFTLFKTNHPLRLFGVMSILSAFISIGIFLPVLWEFMQTGEVPRIPTVILSASLMIMAVLLFAVGLILQNVSRFQREMKRLFYLNTR